MFQDWHLFLVVMLCVVVDVVILTVASSINSARLKPVATRDIRHGTSEVDVGIISVMKCVILRIYRRKGSHWSTQCICVLPVGDSFGLECCLVTRPLFR